MRHNLEVQVLASATRRLNQDQVVSARRRQGHQEASRPLSAPRPVRKKQNMARVKRAVNAHKKRRVILERAEGYRGQRSRLYRKAKEQVTHSLVYAYRDRRKKKGDFRRLWIQRINAASRQNGLTYNRLIQGLGLAGIEVDRRILAELAVNEPATFAALVETAKQALPGRHVNAPKTA